MKYNVFRITIKSSLCCASWIQSTTYIPFIPELSQKFALKKVTDGTTILWCTGKLSSVSTTWKRCL